MVHEIYDVIIIGAGMGGLGAGIYLQGKNPKLRTLILEHNNMPGGYVSGFTRKGFYFDLGAEGMLNFENSRNYQTLKEFNFKHKFYRIDPVESTFVDKNNFLNMYASKENLLHEIEKTYPHEKENVERFLGICKKIDNDIKKGGFTSSKLSFKQILKVVFKYPNLLKFGMMKFSNFMDKYLTEPAVKNMFGFYCMWPGVRSDELKAPVAASIISDILAGGLHYPKGGMLDFALKLTDLYLINGGKIQYQSTVKKIIVENGIAKGVQLENGEIIKANWLISNGDLVRTIKDYVGEEYFPDKYIAKINTIGHSLTGIALFLGVENIDLSSLPPHFHIRDHSDFNEMISKVREGDFDLNTIAVRIPGNIDSSIENNGKKTIIVLSFAPYEWNKNWSAENGRERNGEYKALKEEIYNKIIQKLERVIPEISKHIILKELSTPLTYERYNLVSKGAWYGPRFGQRLPNLQTPIPNLLFAGSNVKGAGVGGSFRSGLETAKYLLEKLN
ncbi:MAG: hypothetical protein FK734_03635 [Asgard group archaeon]|nr:hypothetical protein [Asgard group archaeon]